MNSIIEFENVVPHVFASQADLSSDVWNTRLTIVSGKKYLVEADSGKGKSTFCSYLLGYRNDYSGKIFFNGSDISSFKMTDWTDIRRTHVSLLFQELRLFPELTAFENVEIKNSLTNCLSRQQIEDWFERLGIADKVNEKVSRMSFGQQQRVALIRSLAQPYSVLIADEPISHLDDTNSAIMKQIILDDVKQKNATLIVTSIGKHMQIDYDKTLKL